MKKIHKLAIKNFKAFQDEEIFEFKGKNVLVYGSNGSGKSSLFWALYTFLQSSIKFSDEEIEKYFDYNNPQSLLNIFLDEGISAKIEMTYIDEETQETHTNIISKDTINTRENQTIIALLDNDGAGFKCIKNAFNYTMDKVDFTRQRENGIHLCLYPKKAEFIKDSFEIEDYFKIETCRDFMFDNFETFQDTKKKFKKNDFAEFCNELDVSEFEGFKVLFDLILEIKE